MKKSKVKSSKKYEEKGEIVKKPENKLKVNRLKIRTKGWDCGKSCKIARCKENKKMLYEEEGEIFIVVYEEEDEI